MKYQTHTFWYSKNKQIMAARESEQPLFIWANANLQN
jgi:hypothetical protein